MKIDKLKQELKTVSISEVSKNDEKSSANLFKQRVCSIIMKDYIAIYINQKFDDILQVIDQPMKLNPNNRESLRCKSNLYVDILGQCLLIKKNLNEALNWYNQAISVDPKHLNSLSAKVVAQEGLDNSMKPYFWMIKSYLLIQNIQTLCMVKVIVQENWVNTMNYQNG